MSQQYFQRTNWCRALCVSIATITLIFFVGLQVIDDGASSPIFRRSNIEVNHYEKNTTKKTLNDQVVESEHAVVAADDARCSEIGAVMLRHGGHAVDAAVATCLCLGVVYPMSSGIGGGGFMVVRSSSTGKAQAFNSRETAPLAASKDMYANNLMNKSVGALSVAVPGEIAGLHEAWVRYGKLPWSKLFQPAIKLAKEGFVVSPYLEMGINRTKSNILADTIGLGRILAPKGKLLRAGDTCYNIQLGRTLEIIAKKGPRAFYNGNLGKKFVKDVKKAGGIITMKDLRDYKVDITDAVSVNVMGFTVLGMPPPSSGTLGLSLVTNILSGYGSLDFLKSPLGLHRFIEALKHMLAIRMNLGDPKFVNTTKYEADMVSPSFAAKLRRKILDNTTFSSDYYLPKWSQLDDHGTTHFCIVDADRNAVSMTSTINSYFGAGLLSPSTGIVLNNEMDDFSAPTEISKTRLPPAPANFIAPNKRPLSSMNPVIVLKDNQLTGVVGASGGLFIIPAVIQVFLNHFVKGMEPLSAVKQPRVYHQVVPNVVLYENWTVINGEHIELSNKNKRFLTTRNHTLQPQSSGAICQLVMQDLEKPIQKKKGGRKYGNGREEVFHGMLTAVSDPRKNGRPAAV
ncbi:hypothetical protein C5167_019927 [Papaver somniferum]|uniref:Glutathione hydrolase n=1 Tax=Papaver somniferum TaxID=3469 RepID=A0A4Y7ITP3_PAPSO|nr:glutathione hydrolase 3-like [Papaver somniferum]RZC51506.1 hypothetical protein C5167_019927 [Papaver somniferum]